MSEVNYIEVEFDGETYRRRDNKRACTFPKLITVKLGDEEVTTKLSYTTVYLDEEKTEKVLKPCVRINGTRFDLDADEIAVAEESVLT